MLSRFCALLLLQFVILSVSAQSSVYFLNQTGKKVLVQKRTILEHGSYPHTLDENNTGYQSIPFQIDEPAILNVVIIPLKGPYGSADGIHYLIKPGDSLIVTSNQNEKPVLAHKSNPVRTHELAFINKHMQYVGKSLPYTLSGFKQAGFSKRIWGNDLKTRDRLLDSLYRPYINTVESFCKSEGIDPVIGRLYKNFYWGYLMFDKLFIDQPITNTLEKSIAVFYRDSLASWSKQATCQDCNNIPTYKNALRKIFVMQFAQWGEFGYMDAVAEQTTGNIRDFLLSRYLLDRMEMTSDPEKLLAYYDKHCENKIYKTLIHDSYTLYTQQSKINEDELATLVRSDKSEIGFTQLLDQLKGNVIYIDFWASWCGPCVAEFPASHKLKEKIKGQKIIMLYLSIDADFNSWIKAREKHKVNDAYSFILSNPDKNELVKKISLGAIPRYIIVDIQGNIVRLDAKRPSDPETYDTLLEILNSTK